MEALLKELDGKDISEVVAGGLSKLASVPSGGGVASGPAPTAGKKLRPFGDTPASLLIFSGILMGCIASPCFQTHSSSWAARMQYGTLK